MPKRIKKRGKWTSIRSWPLLALGVFAGIPANAQSQQPTLSEPADQSAALPAFHQPQLEITPYVWGLQINSDNQIGNQSLNAELHLDKILRSLRGLAELEVVPRYKHVFLIGDGIYASLTLSPGGTIPNLDHINLRAGIVTIAGGYSLGPVRLARQNHQPIYLSFQPFVGAQYTDIAVVARSTSLTTLARGNTHWYMPVVGARVDAQSGRFLGRLEGDFSTFDTFKRGEQVLGAVGYQFQNKKLAFPSLNIGYRYLYEKKVEGTEEVLRLKAQGPLVFAVFHF